MIVKVISGGQTGADIAGVKAAKAFGLQTGGTMPKGFKTLDGPKPEYFDLYGMVEHSSDKYPPRTAANVREAHGTVRFAKNFNSYGEKCTLKYIKLYGTPHFDVSVTDPPPVEYFVQWLENNNIMVLNVAGNSHKSSPNIEFFVINYLTHAFNLIKNTP
jgi:hypothetical protein